MKSFCLDIDSTCSLFSAATINPQAKDRAKAISDRIRTSSGLGNNSNNQPLASNLVTKRKSKKRERTSDLPTIPTQSSASNSVSNSNCTNKSMPILIKNNTKNSHNLQIGLGQAAPPPSPDQKYAIVELPGSGNNGADANRVISYSGLPLYPSVPIPVVERITRPDELENGHGVGHDQHITNNNNLDDSTSSSAYSSLSDRDLIGESINTSNDNFPFFTLPLPMNNINLGNTGQVQVEQIHEIESEEVLPKSSSKCPPSMSIFTPELNELSNPNMPNCNSFDNIAGPSSKIININKNVVSTSNTGTPGSSPIKINFIETNEFYPGFEEGEDDNVVQAAGECLRLENDLNNHDGTVGSQVEVQNSPECKVRKLG